MRKLIIGIVIVGLAGAFVATGPVLRAEILEQVLVKVNGQILSKTDLEQRQLQAVQQQPDFDINFATEETLAEAITDVTPGLLVDSVDELLMVQRGRELGVTLTDSQLDTIVENVRAENNLEDPAQFEAALNQQGLSMADLRRLFERQTVVSRVQQIEIVPRIEVSEAEGRRYYTAHPDEFTTEPGITLREILIEVPQQDGGVSAGLDEEARAQAEELRARVVAGEDFAEIAEEHSASASRANGGLIGPIAREDLAEQFQKLIDPLEPGGVTTVIRTLQGYQFFELVQVSESGQLSFEEARPRITDVIGNEKLVTERIKYIDQLRKNAIIEWRNEDLKKAYEQGLAERAQAIAEAAAQANAQG